MGGGTRDFCRQDGRARQSAGTRSWDCNLNTDKQKLNIEFT